MTNEDWLAQLREVETEERRKDEAGAKAAQELADKQKRHLNKKVREDPTYPTICVHRMTVGEVPSSQLDEIIAVLAHPELKICDDRTGASSNFGIAKATEWNEKFGKQYASEPVTLERAYHKISLKICKDCLQRWKKSPRADDQRWIKFGGLHAFQGQN